MTKAKSTKDAGDADSNAEAVQKVTSYKPRKATKLSALALDHQNKRLRKKINTKSHNQKKGGAKEGGANGSSNVGQKKRRKKLNYGNMSTFIHRVLRQIDDDLIISSESVAIFNAISHDLIERLTLEASSLSNYTQHSTIRENDVIAAVRLIMAPDLGQHANVEGSKAVSMYVAQKPKKVSTSTAEKKKKGTKGKGKKNAAVEKKAPVPASLATASIADEEPDTAMDDTEGANNTTETTGTADVEAMEVEQGPATQ